MSFFRAVGRFRDDLVIGDDWRITAAAVAALTRAAILVLAGVPNTVVALGAAGLMAAGFVLAVIAGARRGPRTPP
jgi:hypothetical protein